MVDINTNNEVQRREDAFRTLKAAIIADEEEDKEKQKRDWAYHTLVDTSHTREDWEKTAQQVKLAREFGDLRPGVRSSFGAKCPYDELAKSTLVDEPPKQKFPPVTAESVFAAIHKEELAKRRAARRRKGKPKTQ